MTLLRALQALPDAADATDACLLLMGEGTSQPMMPVCELPPLFLVNPKEMDLSRADI